MNKIAKIILCVLLSAALAFAAICVYATTYSSEDDPLISLSYINKVLLPQIKEMIDMAIDGKDISDVDIVSPIDTTDITGTETLDPDGTTGEPADTTDEPVGTTDEPVATTSEPIVTTTEPIVTTTEPIVTTTEPVVTTEPEEVFPEGTVNTGSRYQAIFVEEGKTVFASVYSCEVIVRSGATVVVSPFTEYGAVQGVSDTTAGAEIYNGGKVPNNHTIIIPRDDGRGITAGVGGAWMMVRGDYIIKDATALAAETTAETAEVTE